jgi:very-short-patch-repair endonuclease
MTHLFTDSAGGAERPGPVAQAVPVRIRTRRQLIADGLTVHQIARAVHRGELVRLRRDAYSAPDPSPATALAVAIGGRVGCVSALRDWGVWVTSSGGLHVQVAPNAARLTDPDRAEQVHWHPLCAAPTRTHVSVVDALLRAMACQPHADAVASVDSALQRGLVVPSMLAPHVHDAASRAVLADADGRAESGLETIVRLALRAAGLSVEPQVAIDGIGRVDLLAEGAVVVEADGAAWHSGPRRHADHVRDAALAAAGFTPLRFDAAQIHHDLSAVVAAVIHAVRTHRGTRFSGRAAAIAQKRVRRRRSA